MSGKGSARRPGAGYEDAWERIFGKKSVAFAPNKREDVCNRNCPMETKYGPVTCIACTAKELKED